METILVGPESATLLAGVSLCLAFLAWGLKIVEIYHELPGGDND
jgi:hypothetical protein